MATDHDVSLGQSFIRLVFEQGQEWTNDEDNEVMVQLRNIREGQLTHKNMTVREAEKIQDVLKVRAVCHACFQCPNMYPIENRRANLLSPCIASPQRKS